MADQTQTQIEQEQKESRCVTKHIRLYTYYIRYNKFYKEYLTYINTHKPTQDNLTTDIILNSQGG